jgi:hypothetical protein
MSTRQRRLVPMPREKPRARKTPKIQPAATIAAPRLKAPLALPASPIAPSGLKAWHCFAFLIVTAVAWHYAGPVILVIAGFVLFVRGWVWLSVRFPLTMFFVNSFIRALLGGRRRRRW